MKNDTFMYHDSVNLCYLRVSALTLLFNAIRTRAKNFLFVPITAQVNTVCTDINTYINTYNNIGIHQIFDIKMSFVRNTMMTP